METVTTRELTCIGCPMGCPLTVTMKAGEVISVTGNTCKRGDIYARKEVTNPTRIVTSTVRVTGGDAYRRCITGRCRRYGCGYCCNEECWNKELVIKRVSY